MQIRNIFHTAQPFISAAVVIATATGLGYTIYFTERGPQWVTLLTVILVAEILAEAARASRSEWVSLRRAAQLATVKERLDLETQLRNKAEQEIAASRPRLHLIDEVLPTMLVLIDIEERCQYHNRAFMNRMHLRPEQIHGQHLREVLGAQIYQETVTAVRQSLDGQPVHYERTQKMPDGATCKLSIEHIPQFGEHGKVAGFYMLMNDVTSPGDVRASDQLESKAATPAGLDADTHAAVHDGKASQDMFVDSFSEQMAGQKNTSRIMTAIEKGEFHLFCQLITPLTVHSGEAEHYEILVRLKAEEENLMPPGAFFPIAEKYGLMQHLDRWVVQHVIEWVSRHNLPDENRKNSIFFINVSGATIGDPGFPEFLQLTLQEYGVPGTTLCFEIPGPELAQNTMVVAEFARRIKLYDCHVAISGFGRDRVLFGLLRGFKTDFLKIDGSIIFNILRNPVDLAKVTAINHVAQHTGVKTVAELVESEGAIAKLREIGIDFAQGFAISRPRPLGG